MIKSGSSYLRWTAVVAVLALTVIAGVRPSTATKQPPVSGADLANEERALAKYFDDLVVYNHQTAQLSAKAKLVSADIDPLQRQSDDLKARLSGVQNTIREIVAKLKKANEWNDFDTSAAAGADPNFRSVFQQTSFKGLLEESSNGLSSHGSEISLPLDTLRKKLASRYGDSANVQFVRAGYVTPAPMRFISLGCTIGGIRWKLINKLGGVATDKTADQVSCACGNTVGIGTGTPCSQIN